MRPKIVSSAAFATETGFIEEIAFRHIGETDCVAGVVGLELRYAERKFISLTCRVSSDSSTPAETAAVPRGNDLLRRGCLTSQPATTASQISTSRGTIPRQTEPSSWGRRGRC